MSTFSIVILTVIATLILEGIAIYLLIRQEEKAPSTLQGSEFTPLPIDPDEHVNKHTLKTYTSSPFTHFEKHNWYNIVPVINNRIGLIIINGHTAEVVFKGDFRYIIEYGDYLQLDSYDFLFHDPKHELRDYLHGLMREWVEKHNERIAG